MNTDQKPESDIELVQQAFKQYYDEFKYRNMDGDYLTHLPSNQQSRELGYVPFLSVDEYDENEKSPLYRHKSIGDSIDLVDFMEINTPRHMYYSTSTYTDPSNTIMKDKGRLNTDFVFDIDAPITDQKYLSAISSAKTELRKLLMILTKHFGVEEDDIQVYFSGHKGFHVHVPDKSGILQSLNKRSRKDLVGYITGDDVDLESVSSPRTSGGRVVKSNGWGSMLVKSANMRIETESKKIDTLLRDSETENPQMELDLMEHGVFFDGSVSEKVFEKELQDILSVYSPNIDTPVTTDTHRLIRLPYSLHGSTGFRVTPVKIDEIKSFDPFSHAVPEIFKKRKCTIKYENDQINYGGDVRVLISKGIFNVLKGDATFQI